MEKLLHALDARSISGWYHPAMRMQNELLATKEKELALRERIRGIENPNTNSTQLNQTIDELEEEPSSTDHKASMTTVEDTKMCEDSRNHDSDIKKLEDDLNELKSENEKLSNKNAELSVFRTQYSALLSSIDKSDDEKSKIIAQQSEELTHLKINELENKRRITYLKEDHENFNHIIKDLQKENTNIKMHCKQKLVEKTNKLLESQDLIKNLRDNSAIRSNKAFEKLQKELQALKSEKAQQTAKFFKNIDQLDVLNILKDKIDSNIAIIEENLNVDFITKSELDDLKLQLNHIQNENDILQLKLKNMEDTVKLTDDQLHTQQMMISKYSDVEISLRHIIADLQCNSNEKYLIAKTQRELEMAKNREESLKKEIDVLKRENEVAKNESSVEKSVTNNDDGFNIHQEEKNNSLKVK